MRAAVRLLLDLLRSAGAYAFVAGGASALFMALGRALCLAPYWPRGMPVGCGRNVATALLRTGLETVWGTLHIALPGLLAGAALHVAVRVVERSPFRRRAALFGGVAGAALWVWLLSHLEPSYLDVRVGWPAMIAGGASAGAVGVQVIPRRRGHGDAP